MTELEKDLDGLGGLGRVYYNGVGVSLDCRLCPLYDEPRCNSSGGCKEGILQYIASRLAELGYVKAVRCGECVEWHPGSPCENCTEHQFCSEGERVEKEASK